MHAYDHQHDLTSLKWKTYRVSTKPKITFMNCKSQETQTLIGGKGPCSLMIYALVSHCQEDQILQMYTRKLASSLLSCQDPQSTPTIHTPAQSFLSPLFFPVFGCFEAFYFFSFAKGQSKSFLFCCQASFVSYVHRSIKTQRTKTSEVRLGTVKTIEDLLERGNIYSVDQLGYFPEKKSFCIGWYLFYLYALHICMHELPLGLVVPEVATRVHLCKPWLEGAKVKKLNRSQFLKKLKLL